MTEVPQIGRHVPQGCCPPAPAGAVAPQPLLGTWNPQVGPTCRGAAAKHGVGTGPRQEQGRLRLPALLSLGSRKQKPLAPGSLCPTALTNALNVVTKAPAVPRPPLLLVITKCRG